MTEGSPTAWAWWCAVLLLSSLAGVLASRLFHWSATARAVGVPLAFGLAMAPFLAGLATCVGLFLAPGASHDTHLLIVLVVLGVQALASYLRLRHQNRRAPEGRSPVPEREGGLLGQALLGLMAIWIAFILFDALLFPLLQNDSLEYSTVARLFYETRSLASYPAIQPEASASGFFGPWTHPPLYPALIYLAYLAQGHADMPGLMRLVAPWFAFTLAGLVYVLGSVSGRVTGLIAALFVVSTPLLAMGAGTGLVDALPASGMALVIAALGHLDGSPRARGLGVGIAVGLALWTHSQAILFVPLAMAAVIAAGGVEGWRASLRVAVIAAVVAAALSIWPYLRNVFVFGSPISDNPAVFAMPELQWKEYFAKARGLESVSEKIQYGLFKGWFLLESYGVVFWFAALGAALLVIDKERDGLRIAVRQGFASLAQGWLLVPLVILLGYFAGVLLSISLGIDLMIKNERYLLVMLPPAALLAAHATMRWLSQAEWIEKRAFSLRRSVVTLSVLGLLIAIILQGFLFGVMLKNRCSKLRITTLDRLLDPHQAKLGQVSGLAAMEYLREHTPVDTLILSERPADLYYSQRKMISYLDPRLLPLYAISDPHEGVRMLRALGVTHIQIPGYSHPSLYNSVVQRITGDPTITDLVYANVADHLYALSPSQKRVSTAPIDLTPGKQDWVQARYFSFGGYRWLTFRLSSQALDGQQISMAGSGLPLLQRNWFAQLLTGIDPDPNDDDRQLIDRRNLIGVKAGAEYVVEFELEGNGYVYALLYQYDQRGRVLNLDTLISEVALSPSSGRKALVRRIVTGQEAAYVRVGFEHRGNTTLRVVSGRMTPLVETAR